MTEVISIGKKLPRYNYYPKSSTKMVAKIDMKPRRFKSQYERADYFALGDSFVNMFLHAQNAFFIKIKGKSLKGLAKCDKQERVYIEEWVDAMPTTCQVIFNFGQVDLNFVRYYKLAHEETYPDETFQEYVEWISSLNRKSIVLGILASPIKQENIYDVLMKYNTLQGVSFDWNMIKKQHQRTEEVRKRWNYLIQKACKKYGVKFINVFDYNKPLGSKFIDQNPLTVHLRYLPTLIEVQKKLPRILINIQKSLQIEEEYVTEKTTRYYKNLQLMEERKRLESIESQQTKTEINSSRDVTEQDEQELQKQVTGIISGEASLDEELQEQVVLKKKQSQSLLQEINFDEVEYEDFSHVTIEVLAEEMKLRKTITSYCTDTFLYHIGRFLNSDNEEQQTIKIDMLLSNFLSEMINYGVDSIDTENQSCEPTWMLEKIQTLTSMILTKQGQQKLMKSFVLCLQQLFDKSLTQKEDDKSLTQNQNKKITIPTVVRFIISIFENQKQFEFPLIKEKLIIRIIQQILSSLFDYLLEQKVSQTKLNLYARAITMIRKDLDQFRQKVLTSKLGKNGLTEDKLFLKFQSIFQNVKTNSEGSTEKIKEQFTYLLYQKYSFAACSQKILTLMLGQIIKKKLLLELAPLVTTAEMKLKSVQTVPILTKNIAQIDQQFHNKIQQIQNKQKEHHHKQKDSNGKCCRCGCLIAIKELLIKPQKTKGKNVKLNHEKNDE